MNEEARSRVLRSKRLELCDVVKSRKRKLVTLFAVANDPEPIPKITFASLEAPPPTTPEAKFLEVSDILQNRLFDESNLPTRRQLRSETSKQRSPIRKVAPETRPIDTSRKAAKVQRDGSRTRKSRANTPGSKSDAVQGTANDENAAHGILQGQPMRRSTSKGSQTELPAEESAVLDEIIEETFEHATHPRPESSDDTVPPTELASEQAKAAESPLGSPGADPRKVMPISAEDAAELPGPLVEGLGSNDGHHKAATVHLPPKEVQEHKLREARRAREQKEHLSINLPPRDGGRAADPLSSPGSTIDAHSATTPALHDASTDTSPDNEGSRYEPDRLENKEDDVETPIEFRKTPEEIAEKERHDRILKAQMDISSAEILRSSPIGADDQLRGDQAASLSGEQTPGDDSEIMDTDDTVEGQQDLGSLTTQASTIVRDIIEDAEEVADAPTPEDVAMSGVEDHVSGPKEAISKQREVADSEAEDQTPVPDAMDVDATVQDSFDSNATVNTRATTSPLVHEASAPVASGTDSKKLSVTPAASTPLRTPSTPAAAPPTLERMTTRVQSGAMRQRSVTEILSEIDRPNTTPSSERSGPKGATEVDSRSHSPSRSTTPQSPGRMRSLVEKAKERERSKLSTVIFPKDKGRPSSSNNALVPSAGQPARDTNGDYFMPLFLATASTDKRGVPSLDNLLQTAHKTITTSNAYIPINENQTAKVLRRIYNLQSSGKWSLRQPKRQAEPKRQETHWDVLLQEAKWMRTDFREERKWKMTVARNLAYACVEWVESNLEDRKLLQVKATPPKLAIPQAGSSKDTDMAGEGGDHVDQTPELVASGEFDSLDELDDEPRLNLEETVAPAAIFALQDDDVVFGLRKSPTTDKLLDELPMYGAPLTVPLPATSADSLDPDRFWKRRALPLSRYVEGRMELKSQGPPRKKSRFEYDEEDDDDDHVVFGEQDSKRPILPPEQTDVALFNPEHKHTRDRIHAGHQFRPPSEYPMPLQSFFECRTASQWTWAEDDELKAHVREYSYNWSLISSMLTSRSLFSSGAERRTPWECFERWISLEGLPADMQKTHYFRAYNSRLEAANRNVTAQAAQAAQQVNGQGVVQPPRRRSTISFRVERRRQQKHLTLVDAMRKLAKKRETSIQKQQHAAGLAAMRKAQEVSQPRAAMHTPQDFSKLKFDREERMREQMQIFQQRQEQSRRAAMQARIAGQTPQQAIANGATPQQRGPTPANGALPPNPNGTPTQTSQNLTVPGQNRARGPMPAQMAGQVQMTNGLRVPQPMMNGVPQAQMQAMQGGQLPMPNPALDVGLVARAQNISEQQRQAIRMQQAGQIPLQGQNGQVHNSPPRNMSAMSPPNFPQMPNSNMLAFNQNNVNGVSSPGPSPSQGQAGSPRMGQPQQLSNGMVPQALRLEESIRQKYPNASQEQVLRMISDTLAKSAHQRQGLAQSAMNAAAGGNMNMNGMVNGQGMANMNGGQGQSPQLYAQMLRQQQENQQKQLQAAAQQSAVQAQAQAAQAQQASNGQGHQRSGSGASGK